MDRDRTLVYFCKNSWWDARKARKVLLPLAFAELDGCRTVLVNAPVPSWGKAYPPSEWHHPSAAMNVLTPRRRFPGQRWSMIRWLNQRAIWSMVRSHLPLGGKIAVVISDPESEYIARFAHRTGFFSWFDWTEDWDLYRQCSPVKKKAYVNPRQILNEVDGIIAVSRDLLQQAEQMRKPVFYLPNAVSDAFLSRWDDPAGIPAPADYSRIPRPRAVHIGSNNPAWIDWPLLIAVAERLPQVSFCMIGGDGSESGAPMKRPPNIRLLGLRAYEALPPLLAHADLCLLLYRPSTTSSGDPTKLYEYLTSGRPIVSTPHPRAVELRQWLQLAATPETFAEAVVRALREHDQAQANARRAFASTNTWSRRAASLRDRLFGNQGPAVSL